MPTTVRNAILRNITIGGGIPETSFLASAAGTTSWTVPVGVTSICAVCIGAGGGGAQGDGASGGGGGGLGWKNNIAVTPGETLTITVGAGGLGAGGLGQTGGNGGTTSISRGATVLLSASGGVGGDSYGGGGLGGTPGPTATGGGNGGQGGNGAYGGDAGGGGAGGWTGPGGFGGGAFLQGSYDGDDGGGGGGGGGGIVFPGGGAGGGGGGTNPQGQGTSGRFGLTLSEGGPGGGGGSAFGSTAYDGQASLGGWPGGGGGDGVAGNGANGAVNIIWGAGVSFPRGLPPAPATTYQIYDTQGTYYWRAPAGVTSVNVACIGGGGAGGGSKDGGAGGGLGWKNNIAVVPGQDYLVQVGGAGLSSLITRNGGDSYFIDNVTVLGGGGGSGDISSGGVYVGDGGYSGGRGGNGNIFVNGNAEGGSAATFTGPGADGNSQIGNTNYGPGVAMSLRGLSGPSYDPTQRAGRFGAGAMGNATSTDYDGQGGSGGVWIDWTPGGSFPSLGI